MENFTVKDFKANLVSLLNLNADQMDLNNCLFENIVSSGTVITINSNEITLKKTHFRYIYNMDIAVM